MKEAEIVTSTGDLGASNRSFDRFYINGKKYVENSKPFINATKKVERIVAAGRYERTVFRGIVGAEIMSTISSENLNSYVEVAFPLHEFTRDESWFLSMAHNNENRTANVSQEAMIQATAETRNEIVDPLRRIQTLNENGYGFSSTIIDDDIDQIDTLWGDTFGWEKDGVSELQKRLQAGRIIDPSQRDVWFSAIKNPEGTVISLAMAERLSRPGANNSTIDIVESTEWKVHPVYTGRGLMPATLALLNAQVLDDLQPNKNNGPLIYAECNFTSRSDRAGSAAGFSIPSREYAPQMLVQNVQVEDGRAVTDGKLRDFTFMYLGADRITQSYSLNSIGEMIKYIQA